MIQLQAAEEHWLRLAEVLTDEAVDRQLKAIVPTAPDQPASLRALAALAIIKARRLEAAG